MPVKPRPTSDVVSDDLSFVVRTVPSSAMPKTPPTSRLVFVIAEPSPARCGPTAFITAAVIGAMTEAMPWPMITNTGAISQYDVSTWSCVPKKMSPAPDSRSPYVMGAREPWRDAYFPASGAVTMIISVIGRNRTPAWNGVYPRISCM